MPDSGTPGRSTYSYFKWAFLVTGLGLVLGLVTGWIYGRTPAAALSFLFITAVLAVLEISLSFDNAIVNARKLKTMSEIWRRRFLTWGILIAVFGMRIVFPLLIIVVAAGIGPWEALRLAATQPDEYSHLMHEAHLPIAAFGGTFLMMVSLTYFFDAEKDVHWIRRVERRLAGAARIRGIEAAFVLLLAVVASTLLPAEEGRQFIIAATYGLLTFLLVDAGGAIMDGGLRSGERTAVGGLGAFLYLEVLDASFSFDGVVGAFALSHNIFIIAIGLGIGAMYVRSMTVMLVERGTLNQYRFLEHGAFYAIFVLSVIMYLQAFVAIPEVITGFIGVALIGAALWSSVKGSRARGD
ncbi:DUF475 domain-containing protein [Pseudoroseicyclus tamaricis]|uniref:DUF475 domain-containing protein n=1 Tax=Pseudoroseicyclus tamaricis TaxID=2705421 RepID=A0A6B2JQN5_9RHOB|nr:DUF475 domain-containing protein [Pseudoroseicyclus tamaricis]NDV00340.1 DUF475 domain-containing protein [Pseudoroseicyclus tamaricis]